MLLLYVITLFLSAGLLFLVQPMFAKMVLPLLGGTPAVWNTCMVFFQAALLTGYAYAHLATKLMGVRKQAAVHVVLMLVPLLVLPLAVPEGWTPPSQGNPVGWLLLLLAVAIGLPFFVTASTAPLLQKWFSATGHHTAGDPYYLYAASNAGSMLALLAYPALFEPTMVLGTQSWVWSGGYALLILLIWGCAAVLWKSRDRVHEPEFEPGPHAEPPKARTEVTHRERAVSWPRRLRWIGLAAAPSSLMLGVTTYITTDIAVVPLLWVIPLALYLLSFILVFAKRRVIPHRWILRLLPIAAVVLLLVLLSEATEPVSLVVVLHLVVFFIAAMACHGELANDRPATSHLTEYYLLMSLGGMLGGMFNAIVAPLVFISIAEYPTALVASCLLVPSYAAMVDPAQSDRTRKLSNRIRRGVAGFTPRAIVEHRVRIADFAYPAVLGLITYGMVHYANWHELPGDKVRLIFTAGIPAVACYLFSMRPVRFGLALGAVFIAGSFDMVTRGMVLEAHRSFFGVHRVTIRARDMGEGLADIYMHLLYHGTTLHGVQFLDEQREPKLPNTPLTYYHRKGPIGQVFSAYEAESDHFDHVGIVGLGAGGLLAYGDPGDQFTVFEIDPVVEKIATNPELFTFYRNAVERGVAVEIVLGDARLTLDEAQDESFDLLILDAFSSDSIPVHLLTKEAAEMYLRKLTPHGVLAFHISNRYLNLEPVMAALAESLGIVCVHQRDVVSDYQRYRENYYSSEWVVMTRTSEDQAPLRVGQTASKWLPTEAKPGFRVWTDDFSNILSVFDWGLDDFRRER